MKPKNIQEKIKRYAEIGGKMWEADIPFCGGCPEYILGRHCGYEGNGCRFPEHRIKKPKTFISAYYSAQKKYKFTDEEIRKIEIETYEKP
jgi:hypothetical protein